MRLYGYWRSSSSWRVRAALALKGVSYDYVGVHLIEDGGEQHSEVYRAQNPMEQVPMLEVERAGRTLRLAQSMAILEFIEESYREPALLPSDLLLRGRARQLAEIVNSGIQPLQNLSVINMLRDDLGVDAKSWCQQWIVRGLSAYEALAAETAGTYSVGDRVSFADLCLVPQLYNARRFDIDLNEFALLTRIEAACLQLDAFVGSHPDKQPDAPKTQ
ncbi:MAG: maleylacetoacetate isomerase [Bradymonadaceae bacterium]|nr:maleylacetoacetate isomerase [Lujinxingiaceae bacterium]